MYRRRRSREEVNCYYDCYRRQRSISEPRCSDGRRRRYSYTTEERFPPLKYPHEVIPIDNLHFYRRRAVPDQRISTIKLHDCKSEPSIPHATEYRKEYSTLPPISRNPLLRKSTSLRFDQDQVMDIKSEAKSKYVPYSTEDIRRSRAATIKNPDSLKLSGDIELFPEYRSAFCHVNMSDHYLPRKIIRPAPVAPDPYLKSPTRISRPSSQVKKRLEKCHLSLEGQRDMCPEYRSKYTTLPLERSKLMPQGSHLSMQGRFHGVPEYQDSFQTYNRYAKNAPIRKCDNLKMSGTMNGMAEYTERYQEPDWNRYRRMESYKKCDNLRPGGEFSKDRPEYYESYRDYHITSKPEKGKCRDTYFKLQGDTDWNPEYRSTYTDFPRSRPIIKKPESHIRLTNSEHVTPTRRFKGYKATDESMKPDDPLQQYLCQPEVRRAQMEMMIRPRPPMRENASAKRFINEAELPRPTPEKQKPDVDDTIEDHDRLELNDVPKTFKKATRSPFKFIVEDMDNKREPPKFGRRRFIEADDFKDNRTKTTVVEGNPNYVKKTMDYTRKQKQQQQQHDTYEDAIIRRQRLRHQNSTDIEDPEPLRGKLRSNAGRVPSRGKVDYKKRSPSTSEERERMGPHIKYQKEYFSTSDSLRESSEEPFKVMDKVKFLREESETTDEAFTIVQNGSSQRESSTTSQEQHGWMKPIDKPVYHKPLKTYQDNYDSNEETVQVMSRVRYPKAYRSQSRYKSTEESSTKTPARQIKSPSADAEYHAEYTRRHDLNPVINADTHRISPGSPNWRSPSRDEYRSRHSENQSSPCREEYRGKFSGSKGRYIDENSNIRYSGGRREGTHSSYLEPSPPQNRHDSKIKQSGWMQSAFTDVK